MRRDAHGTVRGDPGAAVHLGESVRTRTGRRPARRSEAVHSSAQPGAQRHQLVHQSFSEARQPSGQRAAVGEHPTRAGCEEITLELRGMKPVILIAALAAPLLAQQNRCASNPGLGDIASKPSWNGWGAGLTNTRFQSAAQLPADQVSKLK